MSGPVRVSGEETPKRASFVPVTAPLWWISTDRLSKGGVKVLGPFCSRELALKVRPYVEQAHAPLTYWVDSETRAVWSDTHGIERTPTPWGFNAFVTPWGAELSASYLGTAGSVWYIWQLSDGSYGFTSVAAPITPGYDGAELLEAITLGRRRRRGDPAPVIQRV